MKMFPCAKINLGLYVTERRPDGYHNLETVFYPIPLCDELEVELSECGHDTLEIQGLPTGGDHAPAIGVEGILSPTDNLVMRVVQMLREEGRMIPPLRVRLRKEIPSGAGLGGGSSDAAAMMRVLCDMFSLGLTEEDMERRVARLGADCAFFIRSIPVFATGIGDQFTPLRLDLSGLWLVLVKPSDFVSTREAYAAIVPRRPHHNLRESILRPIEEWSQLVTNDFEDSVFPTHPAIAHIKQRFYDNGALYAAMSGSGSSVFGLFRNPPSDDMLQSLACAKDNAEDAECPRHFIFSAQLTSTHPHPTQE